MNYKFKSNFVGYFLFYYRLVGQRMIFFLFISMMISFLDGIGLAMFIPLLQSVDPENKSIGNNNMGNLGHLTQMLESVGIDLNISSVLIIMLMVFIMKGLMRMFQMSYYARLRQLFLKKVRYSLVENLQDLSYDEFLRLDAGKIQNTLTVEVQRLFQTMRFYFDSAQALVMLCTYILFAFLSNYQFALLVFVGASASNFIYRRIYKAAKKVSVELSGKGSDFNGFLIQTITYFKYLKSTNTFARYTPKLKKVIDESEYLQWRSGIMNAITTSLKEPLIVIMVVSVIYLQITFMGANLSTLILSLMLFYRALSYLVMLQNHWQGFVENIGGMNSVATMLDRMQANKEKNGLIRFDHIENFISLENVTLKYEHRTILDNVSLRINRFNTVAIIGESGAGKTTIANLIAALITPTSGQVTIDGIPLKEMELSSYREKIGYISQETVIFNDSVYNNITFWAEPTPQNLAKFNEVIEIAFLKDFVESIPGKEHAKLGDNGIRISGGQKQRISIARELFKSSEIMIFDEATSALDSETEKIIQANIEKLYGSITMVLIAHRLSTIRKADTIYLVEQGRIVDSGSFEEMIDKSIRFKELVSLQIV